MIQTTFDHSDIGNTIVSDIAQGVDKIEIYRYIRVGRKAVHPKIGVFKWTAGGLTAQVSPVTPYLDELDGVVERSKRIAKDAQEMIG